MACCAFAAFLISQIILALDGIRAQIGLAAVKPGSANPNAEWRLGMAAAAVPVAPRSRFRFAAAVTLGAVLIGAGIGAYLDATGATMSAFDFICTRNGLVAVAALDR